MKFVAYMAKRAIEGLDILIKAIDGLDEMLMQEQHELYLKRLARQALDGDYDSMAELVSVLSKRYAWEQQKEMHQ